MLPVLFFRWYLDFWGHNLSVLSLFIDTFFFSGRFMVTHCVSEGKGSVHMLLNLNEGKS